MPRQSKLKLPPIRYGEDDSLGQRIARIRKARGYTQNELADRIGTIQVLVSDYERGRLRLTADMVVRFARALEVTTDELLGITSSSRTARRRAGKILRRLEQIDSLRPISRPSCSRHRHILPRCEVRIAFTRQAVAHRGFTFLRPAMPTVRPQRFPTAATSASRSSRSQFELRRELAIFIFPEEKGVSRFCSTVQGCLKTLSQ